MTKRKASPALSTALMLFGAHCGAGFITGRTYVQYYGRFGWIGLFTPIISWLIMCVVAYFLFEMAAIYKVDSYKGLASHMYGQKLSGVFTFLWDVWFFVLNVVMVAVVLSGAGSLFEGTFGMPYMLGVFVMAAAIVLILQMKLTKVLKISDIVGYLLILLILILGVVGLRYSGSKILNLVSTHTIAEGTTYKESVMQSISYAGGQIGLFVSLIRLVPTMETRKERVTSLILSFLFNTVLMIVIGFITFAGYPDNNLVQLPVLEFLQHHGGNILLMVYVVLLMLAQLSTGVGALVGGIPRWSPVLTKLFHVKEKTAGIIYLVVICAIAIFVSQFGLMAVFGKSVQILQYFAIPFVMIASVILGPIHMARAKKEKLLEK